jgi:hypothetical protein
MDQLNIQVYTQINNSHSTVLYDIYSPVTLHPYSYLYYQVRNITFFPIPIGYNSGSLWEPLGASGKLWESLGSSGKLWEPNISCFNLFPHLLLQCNIDGRIYHHITLSPSIS